jgi:hypothetical protein
MSKSGHNVHTREGAAFWEPLNYQFLYFYDGIKFKFSYSESLFDDKLEVILRVFFKFS